MSGRASETTLWSLAEDDAKARAALQRLRERALKRRPGRREAGFGAPPGSAPPAPDYDRPSPPPVFPHSGFGTPSDSPMYGPGTPVAGWHPPPAALGRRVWLPAFLVVVLVALPIFAFKYWSSTPSALQAVAVGLVAILSGLFVGGVLILIVSRVSNDRARVDVRPLDAESEKPLSELERFAMEQADRRGGSYRLQLRFVIGVAVVLAAVLASSLVLFVMRRIEYGAAFGSTSISGLVLARWKWQPFERVAEARRSADNASVLAIAIGRRLRTIEEIPDPERRQELEWQAAKDFLDANT